MTWSKEVEILMIHIQVRTGENFSQIIYLISDCQEQPSSGTNTNQFNSSMLISSTYKDLLAPAHNLSGPKIQHVNRDVHWYKQHVVHKHYINTELGKPNAHNILQHIYTLFVSSITSTPTVWPFQHQVFEVFHARTVPPPGVCPNKINIPYPHLDILNTESHYRGYLACPPPLTVVALKN